MSSIKTLYLSGPISGIKDFKNVFREAQMELEFEGYTVINPCHVGTLGEADTGLSSWATNMRGDVEQLMNCQGVALLPGWQSSKGATIEAELALHLEMPVMLVSHWLELVR